MKYVLILAVCTLASFSNLAIYAQGNPTEQIKLDLEGDGVEFSVHGAYEKHQLYALTWRDPKSFFHHFEFPVYGGDVDFSSLGLKRHDKVLVKGTLVERKGSPPHIEASSIEVISRYTGHMQQTNPRNFQLNELLSKERGIFQVHTLSKNTLLVEYKDVVLPMLVRNWSEPLTKLFRGDVVDLPFTIFNHPDSPPHLMLDLTKPFTKKLAIQSIHGKPALMTGCLVRFPKSPQIRFDIYAVLNKNQWGFENNFTIVNFESMELFEGLRLKLENAWKAAPQGDTVFKRNRYINCRAQVTAKGTFNLVSPNQANPQILVDRIEDVSVHLH